MFKNIFKTKGKIDLPFLLTLLLLIAIGLLMVLSASMYYSSENASDGFAQFKKQLAFAVVGLLIMYALSRVNYKLLLKKNFYIWLFIISLGLLLLVFVPGIGVSVNGARRWINVGFTTFQPSEIVKMTGIIYVAGYVTKHPKVLDSTFGPNKYTYDLWFKVIAAIGIACLLTIIEPSMSAAIIIGIAMVSVLWYGGVRLSHLLPLFIIVTVVGVAFLFVDFRFSRLLTYFGQSSTNYQIKQSLLAIGSGGFFGVGLGNGKQKLLFLPEIQNDFIFANIGEELGMVGCAIVIILYVYLIYRGFKIGTHCKDRFGFLYTLSVMTVLAVQVIVNIAVATSIFPVTGMALPFISYGGTSIVILLATIGPVLNISRTVNLKPVKKKVRKDEDINSSRRDRRTYISRNSHI